MSEPVRVLIVDDSPLIRNLLQEIFERDQGLKVVGVAANGRDALARISEWRPHLITLDLNMPVMNGLETTREIMTRCPTPILIISSSLHSKGKDSVFELIACGALDVLDKAALEMTEGFEKRAQDLINHIKLLARIKVIRHPFSKIKKNFLGAPPSKFISPASAPSVDLIAIAASTGGPQALNTLLKNFPENFPCALMIVQHIASGFVEGLVKWLQRECKLKVVLAEDRMAINPAQVYIAPSHVHMNVVSGGRISLTDGIPFEGNKPSGNALFESVAKVYGPRAVGVVLTGMGHDGAAGSKKLKEAGGRVIAQDEKTSAIFGMPKAAIDSGAADRVLPIEEIGPYLIQMQELRIQ